MANYPTTPLTPAVPPALGMSQAPNPTLAPAPSPSTGNSIGTGLTPTPGVSNVTTSGLGGGNAPATLPKSNAYYMPGDTQGAQQLSPYYNLVPYTNQQLGAKDVALGGAAVIPDAAVGNATRLAGADRIETASKVTAYLATISNYTPEQYSAMTLPELQGSIQGASQAVNDTFGGIKNLVDQAVNDPGANVAPILADYMGKMETFFTDYLAKAQSAYDNGMNDPGLLNAISMIKDEASGLRAQLDETLNARGMSQSGVYVSAMNNFDGKVMSAEQTAISTHLSELTKNLQAGMTSVLNQRVAALTQFAGLASQAEIQNATNHMNALTSGMSALGQIAQTQQSAINNERDNTTSIINNAATNATSKENAQKQYDLGMEQVNVDKARLAESIREFDANNKVDWAKVAEQIRSNQAGEAIALVQASAAQTSAGASALSAAAAMKNANTNALNGGVDPVQKANFQATTTVTIATAITSLKADLDAGRVSASDILNNQDKWKLTVGVGANALSNLERDTTLWNNFASYAQSKVPAPSSPSSKGTYTPTGNWFLDKWNSR